MLPGETRTVPGSPGEPRVSPPSFRLLASGTQSTKLVWLQFRPNFPRFLALTFLRSPSIIGIE